MKKTAAVAVSAAAGLALAVSLALVAGCEVSSGGNSVVRAVELAVAGLYANAGGRLVSRNSGAPIVQMNLMQTGSRLQGVDNNNRVFKGSIGRATATQATFQLDGSTTAGAAGKITGTIDVSGTTATMRGTWIENGITGNVYGQATVPTNAPPTPPPTNTTSLVLTPSGTVTLAVGNSQAFTATGGSGAYAWSLANGAIGSLAGSGGAVTYTASAVGTQTVSVTDGSATRSATVLQN